MDCSDLDLDNKGVADCTALTKLSFVNYSNIYADRDSDCYRYESCPPVAMRRLVYLSDITVALVKPKVSLGQFGAQRKLGRLCLLLQGTSYLTGGSASLTSLTQLKIHVLPDADKDPEDLHLIPAADIRVNWGRMYSLVSFVLVGSAKFSSSTLQVCCVSQLKQFVLVGFKPGNQQTVQYIK